jgi:hypothetical protein
VTVLLALDRMPSVHSFDSDGRMRVRAAPISKAGISVYLGDEVPGWRLLGLDPDREYRMYRSGDALSRAAASFRRLPVLNRHISSDGALPRDAVVGCTGADPFFDGELLRVSLCIWTGDAIDGIQSGEARQLSCAYGYSLPAMIRGRWRGQTFDGKMVGLRGKHVALVDQGRAGTACGITLNNTEEIDGGRYTVA